MFKLILSLEKSHERPENEVHVIKSDIWQTIEVQHDNPRSLHTHTHTYMYTHTHTHMYTHTVTMVNLSWFRRRQQQQLRYYDKPARERHYLSLVGSVLCIVLLILALALREWGKGSSELCSYVFGLTQVHIKDSTGSTDVKPSQLRIYLAMYSMHMWS